VATVSALLSTHYGHLLLVKLGLFGLMLAFAAVNRATLTPTAADRSVAPHERIAALRRLRRNAMAEAGLGLAVLALVGALGLSMPAVNASQAMPAMHMH
jgi:putative copper resistance protein D